jgi:hypothetical protein
LAGGINPYAYVQNNPLNWIDPLGLIGVGVSYGGAISLPGFRFSTHFELRFFRDSTKSVNDLSSYSFAITNTTTYANNWDDDPCNNATVYGAEVDFGPDILISNANHYSHVEGMSNNGGLSAGWSGVGGDFEFSGMLLNNLDRPHPEGLIYPDGRSVFELSWFVPLFGQNWGAEFHENVRGNTVKLLGFN